VGGDAAKIEASCGEVFFERSDERLAQWGVPVAFESEQAAKDGRMSLWRVGAAGVRDRQTGAVMRARTLAIFFCA
jgi:hypothetical protein